MHYPRARNQNANPRAAAGQRPKNLSRRPPQFKYVKIPGGFVSIPEHIRPFLDTTHEPTKSGLVPNRRPGPREEDGNVAGKFYYKLRRLSPVRHPATNRLLITYDGVEIRADTKFAGHQFDEYIFHAIRKPRVFLFRVEKQAARTGHRHARGLESTRCRFASCPVKGTIRGGSFRVCISEFLDPENVVLDPYHNAAYVHLECLETFCNLPSLLAETNITFLPAGELAKEAAFPPALNAAERDACLKWTDQARSSWRAFKTAHPHPASRPPYKPQEHDRLYYRLEQIRELSKPPNKRKHGDYNGPQVYTYGQGQQNANTAPEPAPKKHQTEKPTRISVPVPIQNGGAQIRQAGSRVPHQGYHPASRPQICNNPSTNGAVGEPLLPYPGLVLPSVPEENPQLPTNDNMAPAKGIAAPRPVASDNIQDDPPHPTNDEGAADLVVEYSTEEIDAILEKHFRLPTEDDNAPDIGGEYSTNGFNAYLAEDYSSDLADYLGLSSDDFSWNNQVASHVAEPQDGAGTQPE